MTQSNKSLRQSLLQSASATAHYLTSFQGEIADIGGKLGDITSSVDKLATIHLFDELCKNLTSPFVAKFEDDTFAKLPLGDHQVPTDTPCLVIDEIDGTTNFKRSKDRSNPIQGFPKSATTVAYFDARRHLIASAVVALDDHSNYTSELVGSHYSSYYNESLLDCSINRRIPSTDTKVRLAFGNYSNPNHITCAAFMESVERTHYRHKIECYGGCRSSTMDIVDILRGNADCYCDFRASYTSDLDSSCVLRFYDVAAVLPIAIGAGLKVCAPTGENIQLDSIDFDMPISLFVGRPDIVDFLVVQFKHAESSGRLVA